MPVHQQCNDLFDFIFDDIILSGNYYGILLLEYNIADISTLLNSEIS